jgi:hypothetical protein
MSGARNSGDASPATAAQLGTTTIRSLLAAQGFSVPDDDLEEITVRLNGLVAGLVAYDEHRVEDEEPWSEWPGAPRHG